MPRRINLKNQLSDSNQHNPNWMTRQPWEKVDNLQSVVPECLKFQISLEMSSVEMYQEMIEMIFQQLTEHCPKDRVQMLQSRRKNRQESRRKWTSRIAIKEDDKDAGYSPDYRKASKPKKKKEPSKTDQKRKKKGQEDSDSD